MKPSKPQRHTELTREALQLRYTSSVRRVEALTSEIEKLSLEQADLTEQLDKGRTELSKNP